MDHTGVRHSPLYYVLSVSRNVVLNVGLFVSLLAPSFSSAHCTYFLHTPKALLQQLAISSVMAFMTERMPIA